MDLFSSWFPFRAECGSAVFVVDPLPSSWRSGPRLLEDAPGDGQGGARRRPARVEGEVRDHFDQLVPVDAVLESFLQVKRQLVGPIERDERRDRDEAAI